MACVSHTFSCAKRFSREDGLLEVGLGWLRTGTGSPGQWSWRWACPSSRSVWTMLWDTGPDFLVVLCGAWGRTWWSLRVPSSLGYSVIPWFWEDAVYISIHGLSSGPPWLPWLSYWESINLTSSTSLFSASAACEEFPFCGTSRRDSGVKNQGWMVQASMSPTRRRTLLSSWGDAPGLGCSAWGVLWYHPGSGLHCGHKL